MIRARARKGTGAENRASPADYTGPMDQVSVRDAIYQERDWELAHEAKRWFDLVRLDKLEPGSWAMALQQRDSIPATATLQRDLRTFKQRWPIPLTQINLDRALIQNTGY
jgi:hypothetical protein